MKKLLSVLLSVAMIISCMAICFNSFAAVDQEIIDKFNEATKNAASEFEKEDGTMNYASGYAFEQVISSVSGEITGDEMQNNLPMLLKDKYPEYPDDGMENGKDKNPDDCYNYVNMGDDSNPIMVPMLNVPAITKIASGVEEYGYTRVAKFSNGADTIGDYALKAAEVTADMLTDIEDEGAGAYTFYFNDVDIAADELVSESGIAAVMNKYPNLDGFDDQIKDRAAERGTGIKFQEFQIKITNLKMRVVFDGDNLQEIVMEYRIDVPQVTFKFSGETINYNGFVDVKTSYKEFDNYNENSGEMNLSELVKAINEGTAYAVDSKAGYDYSRTAQYPMGATDYAHFSINLTGDALKQNIDPSSTIGMVLSGLEIGDLINAPLNIGVTNILITLDDVAGIKLEALGDTWICNCADCPECEEDSCTADHPCTCTGCHCHYELLDAEDLFGKALAKVSERLQDSVRSGVQNAFEFGVNGATVPAGKDGSAYIGDKAFKATNLNVNDIEMANVNPDGSIMFTMPTQVNPDENSSLAHLTDDYASAGEMMDALSVGFLDTLGVDPFEPNEDGSNSGVTYMNIMVTVKFEEADADNPYGNGKIESLNTFYYCMTSLSIGDGIISGDFGAQVSSNYDDFNYKDYEKGDADVSGRVSIIDAKLVLKHIVGTDTLSTLGFELADMNDDGDIKLGDAKAILKKIADDAAEAASGGPNTSTGDTSGDQGQG